MVLTLRFRDLNIPQGETIRRHTAKIDSEGYTWWGWIMRQREGFPEKLLASLDLKLEKTLSEDIFLFHSGAGTLYPAVLEDVAAYPGGESNQTPEVQKTPTYMAEAECPAWFKLSEIGEPIEQLKSMRIADFPTLNPLNDIDKNLEQKNLTEIDELRLSTATLWLISIE